MRLFRRLPLITALTVAGIILSAAAQEFSPLKPSGASLIDKTRHSEIFQPPAPETAAEDYRSVRDKIMETSPFQYSQMRWNSARYSAENGLISTDDTLIGEFEDITGATEVPKALPPSLQMPDYGTSLSVTGRKVIGFSYTSKKYLGSQVNTGRADSVGTFDLTQEMQVRMQGKIGPKITVNVDYDDTKTNKQDISIIYKGDPQDVVQSASFGDIELSLPATEFVSYNKQLFGIRADLKHKGFKGTFIGSRTKGTTKTKQFVGNTLFQTRDILDTSYMRRQYYDITFGSGTARLPIKQGSIKVYLDNQTNQATGGSNVYSLTADDMGVQTSSYTGKFKLLAAGVDYVVDYNAGVLTFNNSLQTQDVVAINYTNTNGTELAYNSPSDPLGTSGTGNPKLIKTKNDIFIATSTEKGYQAELKTYYSIGQTQIVQDDGKGNFILKIYDSNKNSVGPSLLPPQVYPDNIVVDFTLGIFHLQNPFGAIGNPSQQDPDVYAATPVSKRSIHVEYSSRIKTFTLEANIVVQSESVMVDNVKFTRNLDYYIDYDSGFITFYNESKIRSDSVVTMTYDVSPFGGIGTSALIGSRLSYDFSNNFALGTSVLYETASKARTAPNIKDLAASLLVYEGDFQMKNINLAGVQTTFGAEVAQSRNNPNLNDFAIIENMEGIKQTDAASVEAIDWRIAANPFESPASPLAINWINDEVKVLDINPDAQANSNETQRVLVINYDLSVSSEVSIVFPMSTSGLDFSKKNLLDMLVYANGSLANPGPEFNIHFGQINEDADGTGGITLNCKSGITLTNAPKTEDLNCTGQLEGGEDIGWPYGPSTAPYAVYGANNGRIDTQDLNNNFVMDAQDFTGGDFGYVNGSMFTDATQGGGVQLNRFTFSGWHTLQSSFNISSTDTYKWSAIRQVRISLRRTNTPGEQLKGKIILAHLNAVGNTWSINASSSAAASMNVAGENNQDNPEYQPIFSAGGAAQQVYNDLYGSIQDQKEANNSSNVVEQSLKMIYSTTGTATMSTNRTFSSSIDISQHKQFRFLLNNPPGNEVSSATVFFLRLGSDSDYQQVEIPLTFTGWHL
ncbi:MAG: hypothetical protein WCS77_02725, partial [Elusimicrobiaceae bacterium]